MEDFPPMDELELDHESMGSPRFPDRQSLRKFVENEFAKQQLGWVEVALRHDPIQRAPVFALHKTRVLNSMASQVTLTIQETIQSELARAEREHREREPKTVRMELAAAEAKVRIQNSDRGGFHEERVSQDHVNPRKSDMVSMRSSIVDSMNSWVVEAARKLSAIRGNSFVLGAASVPVVILTNLILLGVEVDASADLPPNEHLEGHEMFCGPDKWWNWSDLLIFCLSIFEIVAEAVASVMPGAKLHGFASEMDPSQLRMMRFLRFVRALRGIRVVRLLQRLAGESLDPSLKR
ncbi:hypothetical protein AK812_SmicGene6811 [Symbiodinium microadriaticum]|uniref:Ion transport domain-containing protein n=1 Tax=Symbiodinium microadriaticum TaxID=2951 RepID=A0A1Q9EQF5_SYMMI|nr:hypothetical protein AK812_SmicGene6811 [Symbiodinium microadriaticum]